MTDLSMATWRTSSFSNGGGNCVQVAVTGGRIAARDSKAPGSGVLAFPRAGMAALIKWCSAT